MPKTKTASTKSLDQKLTKIQTGAYKPTDFIIADAKDADMSVGVMAPAPFPGKEIGASGPGVYRSRQGYIDDMRTLIDQGDIDIMLTSASNGEVLSKMPEQLKNVTLAVRANDSTDIWSPRGSGYAGFRSQPFQTVNLAKVKKFCDLVLYSLTLNNDLEADRKTLSDYRQFRIEAAELGIRYFLEVFNPNSPQNLKPEDFGSFVNDSIVRTLAGVTVAERPIFLKMAYNGGPLLQELTEADSTLIVGLLGGSSGTTRDTFELLARGEKSGARVALFGRKIQRAESQTGIVSLMRPVIEGELTPTEAVKKYHELLAASKIKPQRTLTADVELSDPVLLGE